MASADSVSAVAGCVRAVPSPLHAVARRGWNGARVLGAFLSREFAALLLRSRSLSHGMDRQKIRQMSGLVLS